MGNVVRLIVRCPICGTTGQVIEELYKPGMEICFHCVIDIEGMFEDKTDEPLYYDSEKIGLFGILKKLKIRQATKSRRNRRQVLNICNEIASEIAGRRV